MKVHRGQESIPLPQGHRVERALLFPDNGTTIVMMLLSREGFAKHVHNATEGNKGNPVYGAPVYAAHFGNELSLHPLPDGDYQIQVHLTPPTVVI